MKIVKLYLLIMLLSLNAVAQKYTILCKAETATDQSKGMLKVNGHEEYATFKGGVLSFTGEAPKLVVVDLYIDNKGNNEFGHFYPILLAPGTTNLSISEIDGTDDVKVLGNKYSETYENEFIRPVHAFNAIATDNSTKLIKARAKGSTDTATNIKLKNDAINDCFQMPMNYIKLNPKSPLNFIAIKMMGKGNRIAKVDKDTLKTIYASLSTDIKESEDGKKYEAWLNAL